MIEIEIDVDSVSDSKVHYITKCDYWLTEEKRITIITEILPRLESTLKDVEFAYTLYEFIRYASKFKTAHCRLTIRYKEIEGLLTFEYLSWDGKKMTAVPNASIGIVDVEELFMALLGLNAIKDWILSGESKGEFIVGLARIL